MPTLEPTVYPSSLTIDPTHHPTTSPTSPTTKPTENPTFEIMSCIGTDSCNGHNIQCLNGTDCHIECNGLRACKYSNINCALDGYSCIIDCIGEASCHTATINGGDGDLIIRGVSGKNNMEYATINCPHNGICTVTCSQYYGCNRVIFNGTITDKLMVNSTNGSYVLAESNIICPYSLKTGFSEQCYLNVDRYADKSMNNMHIYAAEGVPDIAIKCDSPLACNPNLCWEANRNPIMHCSEDYNMSCIWGKETFLETNAWNTDSNGGNMCRVLYYHYEQVCKDESNICSKYPIVTDPPSLVPSVSPTEEPTFMPTISPTNSPTHSPAKYDPPYSSTNTLYVRELGCDYGVCNSKYGNYSSFCKQHKFRSDLSNSYNYCCSNLTLTPTYDPVFDPTTEPSLEPTFDPTYQPTKTPTFLHLVNEELRCVYSGSYVSCDINFGINPSLEYDTASTIWIQARLTLADNYINLDITPQNEACYRPTYSFEFERIDIDDDNEYISIRVDDWYQTAAKYTQIAKCGGDGVRNQCGQFDKCVDDSSLGIDLFDKDHTYRIQLYVTRFMSSACQNHSYSLNVRFSIHCSPEKETSLPTHLLPTSLAPSVSPTATPIFESTCRSIPYSWNCFHGKGGHQNNNECEEYGYDGNGVFDIGEGNWLFPYLLNIQNQQVIIKGAESYKTVLNHTITNTTYTKLGEIINCGWEQCYLTFANLVYTSSKITKNNTIIKVEKGGKR
eukprot:510417_1